MIVKLTLSCLVRGKISILVKSILDDNSINNNKNNNNNKIIMIMIIITIMIITIIKTHIIK